MSKHRTDWNEDKYNRFIKEGKGQGIGKNYIPWISIQSFPSNGRVSRVLGWKTSRIHHLLSDLQTRYFYMLEWEDNVIDIREHFPLLNAQEIIKEKEDLKFDLFTDKDSETPYVITTNFLITLKDSNGSNTYLARTIKRDSELEKRNTLERLEIERRYWEAKGIDWGIVTQKEISDIFAKNIEWVHPSLYSYNERGLQQEEVEYMASVLLEKIMNSPLPIRKVATDFDKEFNHESGIGLFLFKFLVASKRIDIDMMHPININEANPNIHIRQISRKEEVKVI